jgi:hypothetical protein
MRAADHRSGNGPVATGDESIPATSPTSSTRSPPTRQHPSRRSRRLRQRHRTPRTAPTRETPTTTSPTPPPTLLRYMRGEHSRSDIDAYADGLRSKRIRRLTTARVPVPGTSSPMNNPLSSGRASASPRARRARDQRGRNSHANLAPTSVSYRSDTGRGAQRGPKATANDRPRRSAETQEVPATRLYLGGSRARRSDARAPYHGSALPTELRGRRPARV